MKFSKLTKKLCCSFGLGLALFSISNTFDANAAKITCTSGYLPIKASYSDSSATVGNHYKNDFFYSNSSYVNGTTAFFEYKAYSGNYRYVNYKQPNGTYTVT